MKYKYYFFDLDHTLIDTDCEWEWKNTLINSGETDHSQREKHRYFLDLHHRGKLPIDEYTDFLMQDFVGKSVQEISILAEYSFKKNIGDKIFPQAKALIKTIKKNKGKAIMLSGSFRPIVLPVAKYLDLDDAICTELEVINGTFSGDITGEFCVMEGKLNKAKKYCKDHNISLSEVSFYGDSHSDIPMMKEAGNSTVVNPKESMKIIADQQDWNIEVWQIR